MTTSTSSRIRRGVRQAAIGIGLTLGGALVPAHAGTVIVNTELTAIDLTGSGPIPFAASGNLGDANNGFAFVEANFEVSQPALTTSQGTTTIVVDPTGGATGAGIVSYHATFDFYLDVVISEVTPDSFHPGLGPSVTVPAIAGDPLTAELSATFGFEELADVLSGTVTPTIHQVIETRTHALDVDINGDGNLDSVSFDALDIDYLTEADVSFNFPAPNSSIDDLLQLILAAGLSSGAPLILDGSLEASAINVAFLGSVNPDFQVLLGGNIGPSPVPIPAPLMLLLGALGSLAGWRRRRAHP